MEALKDNFVFCLFTGWFLFIVAISATWIMSTDSKSELYKHRCLAWVLVAAFGIIMFILQNIYIYLYQQDEKAKELSSINRVQAFTALDTVAYYCMQV